MESCRWYALIGTTKSRPRHFLIWMRTVGQLQHADYRGGCMFKYACCWWTRQRIHNTLWKRSFSHWVFQRYQNFINIGGLTEEPQITHLFLMVQSVIKSGENCVMSFTIGSQCFVMLSRCITGWFHIRVYVTIGFIQIQAKRKYVVIMIKYIPLGW